MLRTLTIHDIVLIDRLELSFAPGLSVLTGETGAGKSILLDALGLALGSRAERELVRRGAERGLVSAIFDIPPRHAAWDFIDEQGLDLGEREQLILRRTLEADGRSRAFLNDIPVGVGLLREVGERLVEIHGQHDDRLLLDAAGHRRLLDAFGDHGPRERDAAAAHGRWRAAADDLTAEQARLAAAGAEEDYLRHAFAELQALAPQAGEEDGLLARRTLLQQGERIRQSLAEIARDLGRDGGADAALRAALRRLERLPDSAAPLIAPIIAPLERAAVEAAEAVAQLADALASLGADPLELERLDERLHALRAAARKHHCRVDQLAGVRDGFAASLDALSHGAGRIQELQATEKRCRAEFEEAVAALRQARHAAAKTLAAAVNKELSPLKLDKARFQCRIDDLPPDEWTADGGERVTFEVATNPGAPFGPLMKIASGGEQSRFILALKVVLAARGSAPTLVFDEVDKGVGGAVASAVGERLARLARASQVLVVTHSPQVAALGQHHWRIVKTVRKVKGATTALTEVTALDKPTRQEEIARMLAGAEVTDEARAAAARLLERS